MVKKNQLILLFLCLTFYNTYAQKIYTVNNSSQSDIKVFVVEDESQADLKVFKIDYKTQAKGNDGI